MLHKIISGSGERLFQAISLILNDVCEIQQANSCMLNNSLSALSFAKEFQTIKVSSCRGAGHDYAIMRLIEEKFDRVAVISQSADQMRVLISQLDSRGIPISKYELFNNNTDNLRGMDGEPYWTQQKSFDALIVNCSFMLSNNRIQDIYQAFLHRASNGVPFFFIFIQ